LGTRYLLLGEVQGWGVDLHVAGGVTVPLGAPAAALTGTAAIAGRWRNEYFHLSVLAVSPVVVRVFPDPTFRLPIAFELWFTVRVARLHLGAQASAGNTFVPGLSWSSAFQASGVLGWSL
jgi:hypothetical protein